MSDFDLNRLIREYLTRTKEADPHVIARRLVARIPTEERDAALASCLGDRVRIEIGRQRMHAHALPVAAQPRPGVSWRKRAASVLNQRIPVPGGGWKQIGDVTADEFDAIADDHARRAAEQEAVAARYRRYAQELRRSGAATLRDLGEDFELGVAA